MSTRSIRSVLAAATCAVTTAALALGLGGLAPSSATPAPSTGVNVKQAPEPPVVPIHWTRCAGGYLHDIGAQCGVLTVPLDYSDPTGRTINLAVSRVKHTSKIFKGAVFTNPGGPGGSGLTLSVLGAYVPGKVASRYDWYGMDPRGVGSSRPVLSCDPDYNTLDRKPYVPSSPAILSWWRDKTDTYAADCASGEKGSGRKLLDHVRTTDNVEDYEMLRRAIGEEQITFYGFSYGTYIAQVYATEHPDSLKAIVMDGVVDPTRVWYQANFDQDIAFQKTVRKFYAWLADHKGTYRLGSTRAMVEKRIAALRTRLTDKPIIGVGPDELDDAILYAGYYNLTWLQVGHALDVLKHDGNAHPVKRIYRGGAPKGDDNGYAMYLGTICSEAPWPSDWQTWADDTWAVHDQAPFYAWGNTWFNAPCRTWPVASTDPVDVDGSEYTGPVLLLNETYDAATPFSGALQVRQLFPTASLVEGVGGTSHAVSLYGVACTDDTVKNLLKDGSLPPRSEQDGVADKKCPPLAPPNPRQARPVIERPGLPLFR
ncbi:alpha/beta fold hydrolase [Nocardioides acrostichi]|uniref:Alpha/beta fold hydrolase n=1 Tax=Nocardioides acrostichi TaxID=2784339 RepID=A0A930Y5T3_9ACTN|nr:alpha/beta fold hydrolase [Nocardioides acrostichi]MBF4161585.1 alpha/beta fold hydrolase [Nocardioides acrostichi]